MTWLTHALRLGTTLPSNKIHVGSHMVIAPSFETASEVRGSSIQLKNPFKVRKADSNSAANDVRR